MGWVLEGLKAVGKAVLVAAAAEGARAVVGAVAERVLYPPVPPAPEPAPPPEPMKRKRRSKR